MQDVNQQHYQKCLKNGCSPRLAEMLAARAAPGLKTDATHFAGLMGRQFNDDPVTGNYLAQELRQQGGSPSGKVYISQLAEYPGDPRGWVGSKGEICERLRESGDGCAALGVKKAEYVEPSKPIELDPDLVRDEVDFLIDQNPDIAPTPKEKAALFNKVYEQRKPNRKPKQTVVDVV